MAERAPSRHRKKREAEVGIHIDEGELAQRSHDEARHRDTEDDEEHDDEVWQAVSIERGQRTPQNAAKSGKHHCEDAKRRRNGEVLSDDVVNAAILLGEGNPEITVEHVIQKNDVLLGDRPVQAIALLQIALNLLGRRSLVREGIARHGVHCDERRRRDEPYGDGSLDEPLEGVAQHSDERLGSFDQVRVGVIRIGC